MKNFFKRLFGRPVEKSEEAPKMRRPRGLPQPKRRSYSQSQDVGPDPISTNPGFFGGFFDGGGDSSGGGCGGGFDGGGGGDCGGGGGD